MSAPAAVKEPARKPAVNYHLLRQAAFENALLFMGSALGRTGTAIDLGAGHCNFSLMARELGWTVTAMDARNARVPHDLPRDIRFIQGDLDSNIWNPSDYDLILCLGVYYHLDQQMQHRFLDRCKGKPLILDTHFANPPGMPTRYHRTLGKTYEKNGETGADYREAGHLSDKERITDAPLASMENPTSWWQTKSSLLDTLHAYGWSHVWMLEYPTSEVVQRTFFVCHDLSNRHTSIRC